MIIKQIKKKGRNIKRQDFKDFLKETKKSKKWGGIDQNQYNESGVMWGKNQENQRPILFKEENIKTEEEKINKLKEKLRETKAKEKTMEEKLERYTNKLRELELIEEEKERQKEEMNNQNQSQIEFGIDNENPFYTEEEGNIPEISLKFTSSQFNQFTYVLFKNFEAKGIVEDEAKNKIKKYI